MQNFPVFFSDFDIFPGKLYDIPLSLRNLTKNFAKKLQQFLNLMSSANLAWCRFVITAVHQTLQGLTRNIWPIWLVLFWPALQILPSIESRVEIMAEIFPV